MSLVLKVALLKYNEAISYAIPALGRLKKDDLEFQASLGHCFKKQVGEAISWRILLTTLRIENIL